MKKTSSLQYIFPFFLLLFLISCQSLPSFRYSGKPDIQAFPAYPDASFAVISDMHVHTKSLGLSGPDFNAELRTGKKLLNLSEEISESVTDELGDDPDIGFVIVCGDLTRDGEKENHLAVQKMLQHLEASGKQVFVVPGNHDINNFNARRFTKTGSERVESITPQEFQEIYSQFGYSEALYQDPDSLSYIAEPVPGLWLFALDGCTYDRNAEGKPNSTHGALRSETLRWIEDHLILAEEQHKAVMGVVHYGILEHFHSQKKYFNDFVLDNWEQISKMFAYYGMRMVFTGHFHAQDITKKKWENKTWLFDIETSSLVTWPCAYRKIRIQDNSMIIKSYPVTRIPSKSDFQTYAKEHLVSGISSFLRSYLNKYKFEKKDMDILIPQMVAGMTAHTAGDEIYPKEPINTNGLSLKAGIAVCLAGDLIRGVWTDLPPADNNIRIECDTGAWKKTM